MNVKERGEAWKILMEAGAVLHVLPPGESHSGSSYIAEAMNLKHASISTKWESYLEICF